MGKALAFSSIDQYLKTLQAPVPGCLVDTQFLIAATEELHPFYDDAEFLFHKLAEYKIPIFTTVTTRAEFIDVRRRFILTETLLGMLAPGSKWKISETVLKKLRAQKTWIDTQAADNNLPLLPDGRIKDCKECFMPRSLSGQIGWIELCREFLGGQLLESWNVLVESLKINYLDTRGEMASSLLTKKLEWEKMYAISETTGLSSSDSMIVNVLQSSKFPFIVSADFDIAYSVVADSTDKTALIPDNLHYQKIKSLRF